MDNIMDRLTRNTKGMDIFNPASGRMESAANPEVHISRLAHFGAGLGVDLTGLNPAYTGKGTHVNRHAGNRGFGSRTESNSIHFDSHDEGLELPYNILEASRFTIRNADAPIPHRYESGLELAHRYPYENKAWGFDGVDLDHGFVEKEINAHVYGPDHPTALDEGEMPLRFDTSHTEYWGEHPDITLHRSHRDAAQRAREVFRRVAGIDRRIPHPGEISPEARDLMDHSLANPDPKTLEHRRRNYPHLSGPQFLRVGLDDSNRSGPAFHDIIDLKTGTWARIHPDEYFPD